MNATASPDILVKSIVYRVPSSTREGVVYDVALNPFTMRPMSCTCPARVVCRHQKQIAAGNLPGKPRVRIGPRPVGMMRASELYA